MSQNISLKILGQISSMEEKLRPPPNYVFSRIQFLTNTLHCVKKGGVGEVIHSIQSEFWDIYCKGLFTNYIGKILDFFHFWQPTWLTLNSFIIIRWYLHIVEISSTTYLPCLVNVVCERPPSDFSGDVITTKHPTLC